MGLYDFRDLSKFLGDEEPFLPAEAMFIDNVPIEEQIDGYQTLNVSGRELLSYEPKTTDIPAMDGKMFQTANYPEREIKVAYKLKAKDDQDFRTKYDYLNYLLSQKQFSFWFKDDPLWSFVGILSDADAVPVGTNEVASSFTILCTDPFKHCRYPVNTQGIGSVTTLEPIYFASIPDMISVVLKSSTNQVQITNGDLQIVLNGKFNANDVLVVRPTGEQYITLNGNYHPELLDYASDLENFKIKHMDTIKVTPATAQIEIVMRSGRL
ncbi:distal tail protein Dit [Agrilactobacillus fermenti]|uniref:distal tail protein Dit n=1 Tax=Agrilactobacillus fermenti TaxID=2586909 RepID=UPI001E5ABCB4|nr:distal tail protein Dit [Agrilactobacillus fermenti]MCD2256406.1 phage tail family protein [Agrilactobacillus fermenti]